LGGEWMSRGVIFDIHMRSLPELVLHAREFDFPSRRPSERAIYVGPCVQTERIEAPFRWEIVGVRRHLALCTLSTVAHASALPKRRAFFEKLMLAIATLPEVTLIVALGPKVEVPHSPEAPGNIRFFRNVPQLAVLRRADLLITHAGSNSVKEAIECGVPMLAYPDRADQPGVAARIAYHGLGVVGDYEHCTPEAISAAIRKVLSDPTFGARVRRMRAQFARYEHPEHLAK